MRTTNFEHLNYWLSQNGQLAKEDLAHQTRIKFFTLDRIIRGVRMASEIEQEAICKATGIKREILFPLAANEGEQSA